MNQVDGATERKFNEEAGRLIQLRRKHTGFSQTAMALEIGVHRNTLMRWEDGDAGVPLWHLLRIAYVLRVNHLMLLPGRELVWGTEVSAASQERDPIAGVELERDPQIAQQLAN